MKGTLLFLLCASVLAAQGLKSDAKQVFDIIEEAKKILEWIKQKVGNAINEALNNLKIIREKIEETIAEIVGNGFNIINDIIEKLLDEINKLREDARAIGEEAMECITDADNRIKNLPNRAKADILKCEEDKLAEVRAIMDIAVNKIEEIYDQVVHLEERVKACGIKIDCLTGVISDLWNALSELPATIQEIVKRTEDLIANLEVDVHKCINVCVEDVQKEAVAIVTDTKECILDIVNGGQ